MDYSSIAEQIQVLQQHLRVHKTENGVNLCIFWGEGKKLVNK